MSSPFLDRLAHEVLVGDGAIGTLLYERVPQSGIDTCYEELNVTRPDFVAAIHRDYIAAGADLIESNTYAANRRKLAKFGLESRVAEINRAGARLAREAARGADRPVYVAGSIGPLASISTTGEGMTPDEKRDAYREHIAALLEGDVDVIIFETFTKLSELRLVLDLFRSLSQIPVITSLAVSNTGATEDGVSASDAFFGLRTAGADIVGLNCHIGPLAALHVLETVAVDEKTSIAVFPNAGHPEFHDGRYFYFAVPEYFGRIAPQLVAQGARLIGGCCGTTPDTVAAIAKAVRGLKPVTRKTIAAPKVSVMESGAPPVATGRESILDIIRKRALIVVEFDPPRTISANDKFIEGARALREAGADAVTLADNSLAIMRTSNLAMGSLIQERCGALPLLHLSCRDRNLIGTQSELLGMHALGIDHVLALTGDPAKTGDHPEATNVYDLNSIMLIALMKRMNEGFALSGRELKGRTRFVIGCTFNPNTKHLDIQIRRLVKKLEAGAQFIMSQPIFDPAQVKQVHDAVKGFGVPMLLGVMPLLNERNAEFLHNEVPGIQIPDGIRARMRGKEKEAGAREGVAIARELAVEVLTHFPGIYLITPMMRYDLTVALTQSIRAVRR